MRLSDAIEQFIKTMLTQDEQEVELKRNELAQYFNCAPSRSTMCSPRVLRRTTATLSKAAAEAVAISAFSVWNTIPANS